MKKCLRCFVSKPLKEYSKHKNRADGLQAYCKMCSLIKNQERTARRMSEDPLWSRKRNVKGSHGLDWIEYQTLLAQGCAVCGGFDKLSIDHNHSCCPNGRSCSKCRRDILCHGCNVSFGFAKESVEILEGLIKYKQKWG